MADKTLERLVPPLDLCKKIPEGAFADSALVYGNPMGWSPCLYPQLVTRDECSSPSLVIAPAPTYEEIMNAIRKLKCERLICSMQPAGWSVACWLNGECHIEIDRRTVLAALKVWFELKGIKYDAR